jgi:hypothetical protein
MEVLSAPRVVGLTSRVSTTLRTATGFSSRCERTVARPTEVLVRPPPQSDATSELDYRILSSDELSAAWSHGNAHVERSEAEEAVTALLDLVRRHRSSV